MATYSALRRFYLIIEKIKQRGDSSFKAIADHLKDNDVQISKRTMQRDINQIRNDFGVEVAYDRDSDQYFINEDMSANLSGFYQFLELSLTAEILREELKDKRELIKYVHFDGIDLLAGQSNLKLVLQAISLKRWISFSYEKYTEEGIKEHSIIPCLLKRYQNRWYVFGRSKNGYTATFGLDRVKELEILTENFTEDEVEIPEGFNSIVGLNYSGQPIHVLLEADSLQAKYLKSLPLHHSQQTKSEAKDSTVFEYQLIANFELTQAILRLGDQVKVLGPQSLQTEIKDALQRAIDRYK